LSFALACAAAPPSTVYWTGPAAQSGTSILILPFSSPPGNDSYRWVGPTIQQVAAADVSHFSRVLNVLAPAGAQPADDSDAALVAGRNSGASFVVFGHTQLLEREVRITGEVMDVSTARSIGGLKATGDLNDLFHLEDAISSQVIAALPASLRQEQTPQTAQTTAPEQPATDQSQPYTSGPTIYDNGGYYNVGYPYTSGGYTYSYPSYNYYPTCSYPYYPYSYYYPFGFYGAFFFDGHDHHDGHHDDHHDGHHDDHHDFHDGHHADFHDGHNDFSHGWSGWSSGRSFTGPTRSPAIRGGGFQSDARSMGGFTRGFSGTGMSHGFTGGGMSRGSGAGMAHGGSGGGMHGGGHR